MVKTIPNRQIITLYVTDEEHESIRLAAQADGRSINSWCKRTLLAQIQGTRTITSTIPLGHDLIDQKRDGRGRFVRK